MSDRAFDKELAKSKLKKQTGATIYSRGFSYYRKGAIGRLTVTSRTAGAVHVEALVSGGDVYETEVTFNVKTGGLSRFGCNCPYDWGTCKHATALGLTVLDRYEEFCESEIDASDIAEYKKAFSEWMERSPLNFAKRWEESFRQSSSRTMAPIRDAEIVPEKKADIRSVDPVGNDPLGDLKRRLQSIGIDVEAVPESVIRALGKNVKNGVLTVGAQFPKRAESDKNQEHRERFLKKYSILLQVGYSMGLELRETNKPNQAYWSVSPETLLRSGKNYLTQPQKDVLALIRRLRVSYYDTNADEDWGKMLGLVRESGMDLYLNAISATNRLSFDDVGNKITIGLSARPGDELVDDIGLPGRMDIFVTMENIFSEKNSLFIIGTNDLIAIVDGRVRIVPISKMVTKVMKRLSDHVKSSSYSVWSDRTGRALADVKYEVALIDEELIRINELMSDLRASFEVESDIPESFTVTEFQKIGPALSVEYDHTVKYLRVRALMDYGFATIDVADTVFRSTRGGRLSFQMRYAYGRDNYYVEIIGNAISYAAIRAKSEIDAFKRFSKDETYGFAKKVRCIRKGEKQIALYSDVCWPKIKALGWPITYTRDDFDFIEGHFKADVKVDFDTANDWFGFDVDCYCGENRITIDDLRTYIENKEQFLTLADGRLLKITNQAELEKFVAMLRSFYQKEGQSFEGKLYHAPELEGIVTGSPYYTAKLSESFKNFMDEAQRGKPVERVKIPAGIGKPLRAYQREGVDWFYFLRKYRFGGILADDMGLGKTLQALSLVAMNPVPGKPSVVICPKTLLFNWEDEVTKFFPMMKKLVISGAPAERQALLKRAKKFDLVITSYPSVKKDEAQYDRLKFNYCLIDEAQYIKNHRTQNAKSVKNIHADYRLALTGTPLENSVSEIWSLFDFVMPGFLGTNHAFGERFERPIMKDGDRDALEALRKKTSCFMLRRTKEKVLKELPSKIQQVSHCQLGDDQNILYQEILKNVKKDISDAVETRGFAKSQIHILAGLTKLRQVCNHPVLLLKDKNHEKYSSAKLDLFLELVDEMVSSGRKVLVFSQFTQMLDILEKELDKKGIRHLYLSGKTKNRKELVNEFNGDAGIPVFLISLKAGGTGLNLVSADNVIIFDPWWNPSVENQAIDRAHRIGQKKTVNVYRLIVKGTIEEKIVQLQAKKKSLFDTMVGESDDLFKKLTWSDVKELFETE
ncbi:MAG: DEAD/DEAH box helicase [Candidatus Moraniibacteriota bacterium]